MNRLYTYILLSILFLQTAYAQIPNAVKVSRDGNVPVALYEPGYFLSELTLNTSKQVFPAPPCMDGEFYVGFQLYYDLGDKNTEISWATEVLLSLYDGTQLLWTKPLKLNSSKQTFISTIFHETSLTCNPNYTFKITSKNNNGNVPEDFIRVKVLLFEKSAGGFDPSSTITLINSIINNRLYLGWNDCQACLQYDIEWVFIDENDYFNYTNVESPFLFKEPIRITTASHNYSHQVYYPTGKLYYRIRAVGVNPSIPEHKINGVWNYAASSDLIENHDTLRTWQVNTVFAEDGKYKKVIQYFDGTLRQRQTITNLNTSDISIVGETLYDYEGRKALDVLPVPSTSSDLRYKSGFNIFQASDTAVLSRTTNERIKYHFDNYKRTNSALAASSGASQYYSPFNPHASISKSFIPNAEGFAYSQVEYTLDGTGRISRQSTVGKAFSIDSDHATKHFYGTPTREELIRLFGTNVGSASYYKKNMVIDANGQASISYLNQQGKVIATALAGAKPGNVDAISEYNLNTSSLTVNMLDKNTKSDSVLRVSHKIVNVLPTEYTIKYDLSTIGSQLQSFGCALCKYDLIISLFDPEGNEVDLSAYSGNQSNGSKSYVRKSITSVDCASPNSIDDVNIVITLPQIGDYTISKTLISVDKTFESLRDEVFQSADVQTEITQIKSSYTLNAEDCDICTTCPAGEDRIDQAINDIAVLDCTNILNQILQYYRDLKQDPAYQPTTSELEAHQLYCKYQRCQEDVSSDIFDKRLARFLDYTSAIAVFPNPLDSDPFFNDVNLNGYSFKSSMASELNNIFVASISYDMNGDLVADATKDYFGAIDQVTDPLDKSFYINESGAPDENGYHVLYSDLMKNKASLSEAEYNAKINEQRWSLYRNYYLEAKRLVKLQIPKYNSCLSLKDDLLQVDLLKSLDTKEKITSWAEGKFMIDAPTNEEIDMAIASITNKCSATFSSSDSLAIKQSLTGYFTTTRQTNFFKRILRNDLATNSDLVSLSNLLTSKGCSLDSIALNDALSCIQSKPVRVPEWFLNSPPTLKASALSSEELNLNNSEDYMLDDKNEKDKLKKDKADELKKWYEEEIKSRKLKSHAEIDQEIIKRANEESEATASFTATSTCTGCPAPEEYQALMALYSSTNGNTWTNKNGWGNADPSLVQSVYGWYGVTTDAAGHVIALNLYNNNLSGVLPNEIGQLSYLKILRLGSSYNGSYGSLNKISGTLPFSMTNLSNLEILDLSYHLFSSIPEVFAGMDKLRELYLVDLENLLGSIPTSIGYLTELRNLHIVGTGLTGGIPKSFKSLSNLNYVAIAYNDNLGGSLENNLSAFYGLPNLSSIHLTYNYFNGSIPLTIDSLIAVTDLRINGNPLGCKIPMTIGNLKTLQLLSLTNNNLIDSIPKEITRLNNLKYLYLSSNKLTGEIPASIDSLFSLIKLDIDNNQLTGTIPIGLTKLSKLEQLNLSVNNLQGGLPPEIGNLTSLQTLKISTNRSLKGNIPSTIKNLSKLQTLELASDSLTGGIPKEIGQCTKLIKITLQNNLLTGNLPGSLSNLIGLQSLVVDYNFLSGEISDSLDNLVNLSTIHLNNNKFTGELPFKILNKVSFSAQFNNNNFVGTIPSEWASIPSGVIVRLDNNQLSGTTSAFAGKFGDKYVHSNNLTFEDLLPGIKKYDYYTPQALVDNTKSISAIIGSKITLVAIVDRNTAPSCEYQWFKEKATKPDLALNTRGINSHTFIINNVAATDAGRYYYKIWNTALPKLTLQSHYQTLTPVDPNETVCIGIDTTNAELQKFRFNISLSKIAQECMDRAAMTDSFLIEYAVAKFIEQKVGEYYVKAKTNCFNNITESFTYTYQPKEYHYTLYYYDQSGNLVSTVPPKGVVPLTNAQISLVKNGQVINPAHTLVTRYQYNSINQLMWQKTPDAGESNFWYNDKGQIKLSQNSQQLIDGEYSFTRYDNQGRIIDVGSFSGTLPGALLDSLNSETFPVMTNGYVFNDRTRTHYDFANLSVQTEFPQENLRSRVSFVEIMQKNSSDTIKTFYNYDIHGNVKSLLQKLPGIESKRTDYDYDLISGNVNFVFYQFGKENQFIHRYTYDADNRIIKVQTSADGFIWHRDAGYEYYLHGPLARAELGEYRVQGLDYYYTLQGWIKGVNMPFKDDVDVPNTKDINAGKDVFSYVLGYYKDDYLPINNSLNISDTRDNVWTRYQESYNHQGLYNGNIALMITDLAKIGQTKNSRAKGLQAMLYQYDQLNRLVSTKGLGVYDPATGFQQPTANSSYGENYTYDGNGNILLLKRNDATGNLVDDFKYQYYPSTNRLKDAKPRKDKIQSSGIVRNDSAYYANVYLQGNSYLPANHEADIKALESVNFNPNFNASLDSDLWAHIIDDDSSTYRYDAIGNLIFSRETGTTISWTSFGKVREVKKGDSLSVNFLYDAMGNRVAKITTSPNASDTITYLRDASGNVLAIYKNQTLTEQPIYGSSRVGEYTGGWVAGEMTLGNVKYELSNHLGNVLSIVSDNIHITNDSTWATVVNATDYYPFGLEMTERTWSDSLSYRYGFNGKEKDQNGEFGNVVYDYGFRIYDPSIAKFLSVDPLTIEYPWYTPYQFAGNKPIMCIDVDGLEDQIAIDGSTVYGPSNMTSVNNEIIRQQVNSVKRSMNQAPISRSPNSPTLGPAPQELESVKKARSNYVKFNEAVADGQKKGEATHPFIYGGPGFGQGFAKTTAEGFRQLPGVILPELAIDRLSSLYKAYKLSYGIKAISLEEKAAVELSSMEASNSGAHFLSRHGSGTTLSQQWMRSVMGLTPDGMQGIPRDASRFFSNEMQLNSAKMAESIFQKTGEPSFTFTMGTDIGEGYLKGGNIYQTTKQVHAVFKNGKLFTMFPKLK